MSAGIEQARLAQEEAGARARAQAYVERFHAPFSLRCGAFLIDYIVIIFILAFSTLWARLLGGGARLAGDTTETIGFFIALTVAVLNLIVLPGVRGQTLGKWATGLRIDRTDGGPVGFGRIVLRHTVGYLLSFLTLGFGFLAAAFNSQGRALHDLVAGTIVVRHEVRRRLARQGH
jgi:uncharacterized RDD family membrane protein YckC